VFEKNEEQGKVKLESGGKGKPGIEAEVLIGKLELQEIKETTD